MRNELRTGIKEGPIKNKTAWIKVEDEVKPTGICIGISFGTVKNFAEEAEL